MSVYSEIVIGDTCVRPVHFNKYEFFVQFDTGECDIVVIDPKIGLFTANLLEDAKDLDGDAAYELLRGRLSLDWPTNLSDGCWSCIDSFTMYYYNYKGVKKHVTLK